MPRKMNSVIALATMLSLTAVSQSKITIKDSSFAITDPGANSLKLTTPATVTFGLILFNDAETPDTGVDVTDIQIYLSDNVDFSKATKEVKVADRASGLSDVQFDINVPKHDGTSPGEKEVTTAKASVTIPYITHCADFSHLCAVIKPDDDAQCGSISGKVDCAGINIKEGTFAVTPADYTLKLSEATSVTFAMTLTNTVATDIAFTDVQLYLSDNEDLLATEKKAKVADKANGVSGITYGDVTGSAELPLSNAVASITIPSDNNCKAYEHLCAVVKPHDGTQCTSVKDKTDCGDSNDATTRAPGTTSAPDTGMKAMSSVFVIFAVIITTIVATAM